MTKLEGAVGIIQSVNTADYTASVKFPEYNNQILDGLQIIYVKPYWNLKGVPVCHGIAETLIYVKPYWNLKIGAVLGKILSPLHLCKTILEFKYHPHILEHHI